MVPSGMADVFVVWQGEGDGGQDKGRERYGAVCCVVFIGGHRIGAPGLLSSLGPVPDVTLNSQRSTAELRGCVAPLGTHCRTGQP